jgi:hypothetical protein
MNGQDGNRGRLSVFTHLGSGSAKRLFYLNSKKPSILGKRPFGHLIFTSFAEMFKHFIGITPPPPITIPWSRPQKNSLTNGAKVQQQRFTSFGEIFKHFTGITPPPPITVRWSRPWKNSMTNGAMVQQQGFTSFGEMFKHFTGITPPPPITVPWSRPWRISAPEFDDSGDDEGGLTSVAPPLVSSAQPRCFASTALAILALAPTPEIQPDIVEEVVQALDVVVGPVPQFNDQVLTMDDLTDQSEEELHMPPLMDNLEVELPKFPNMQNLQPLMVKEVQLEDLVEFNGLAPQGPLPVDPCLHFDNIQLGFVDTFVPPMDPGLHLAKASFGPSPIAIRMWAKFFNSVDQSLPIVSIPT